MRKKLAIVGCATNTRDDVDYSDPDLDVWVFNEAAQKEWCKRADAVLQLHEPAIWKNPLNRGDKEHGKWLMSGDTPTIYMIEQYPEVPKCVRLPREDIVQALLPNFEVMSERARKDYFTSTIAYAIALGTYLGYKEIHTYGVELADEAEYREQQPGAMFWTGIAIGHGVKFVSHSRMFDAPLYPLETFVGLGLDVFTGKMDELKPQIEKLKEEYRAQKAKTDAAIQRYEDTGNGKDEMLAEIKAQTDAAAKFAVPDGAFLECKRYYERGLAMKNTTTTYVFSKHEFVRDLNQIGVNRDKKRKELTDATNAVNAIIAEIEPKKFSSRRRFMFKDLRRAVGAFTRFVVEYNMYSGAMAEDQRFIDLMNQAKQEMINDKPS